MLDDLVRAARRFRDHEQWDLFARADDVAEVRLLGGPQIELETKRATGVGVRLIDGGKLGAASCTGLQGIGAAIDRARAGAALAAPALFRMPQPQRYATVENFDRRLADLSAEQLGELLCSEVTAAVFSRIQDPIIKASRAIRRRAILNSNGISGEHAVTTLAVEISGSIGEGFNRLHQKTASCRFDISVQELLETFLGKYAQWNGLDRAPEPKGAQAAFFSESSTEALLSILERTLKNAAQSPQFGLIPKMREDLRLDPRVTISDLGDADWLPGSAPFDDEGVPKRALKIFEAGRFLESIYDLETAQLWNEAPTGNAVRDFDAPPSAQFSNPALAAGAMSTDEMAQSIDAGVFVEELRNVRLLPQALGQFAAEIGAGFKFKGGRATHSLQSVPVSGNFFHLFGRNLVGIGCDGQRIPPMVAKELYVGH